MRSQAAAPRIPAAALALGPIHSVRGRGKNCGARLTLLANASLNQREATAPTTSPVASRLFSKISDVALDWTTVQSMSLFCPSSLMLSAREAIGARQA
jgi:hypothetical protein